MNPLEQRVAYLEGVIAELTKSGQYIIRKDMIFHNSPQFRDAVNVKLGSATGTKIGTATTEKLGFYGKTPVTQPTVVSTTAGIILRLQDLGLMGT